MDIDMRLSNTIVSSPHVFPYQASTLSSASSSSSSSVFSLAASSLNSDSSTHTSTSSVSWETEDAWRPLNYCDDAAKDVRVLAPMRTGEVYPAPEQRVHPRRCSLSASRRPPPSLIRQSERKGQFVDCLVDSATEMVEVIWPLSVPVCHGETTPGQGVLPLRTFIKETLRRSRTSFSTLQVALYYLILIKAHVPRFDFTMEQPEDSPSARALQCGRRMFLSALILASKYLQDRNYSARAWSKISGLKVCEINTNEMAFLLAVNWKLHVPEALFELWQDTLIEYTTAHSPSSLGSPLATSDWKKVIPYLTPELDTVQVSRRNPSPRLARPAPRMMWAEPTGLSALISSQERTPKPISALIPLILEPSPNVLPPTPSLLRPSLLPTPTVTPQPVARATPAASIAGYPGGTGRQSMCGAMSQVRQASMARSVMDCNWNTKYTGLEAYRISNRRPSVQPAASGASSCSPESMISDHSRSSRASSISSASSVSSATAWAPTSVKLARLATLRCAGFPRTVQAQMLRREFEPTGSVSNELMCEEPVSSPDVEMLRFSDSEISAALPVVTMPQVMPSFESPSKSRKRGRPSMDLQKEVQTLLGADARSFLADSSSCVLPDRATAQSFLLRSPYRRASTLSSTPTDLQWPARSVRAERLPVQEEMGRKRTCCASESNIMHIGGGPGMWDGIL